MKTLFCIAAEGIATNIMSASNIAYYDKNAIHPTAKAVGFLAVLS